MKALLTAAHHHLLLTTTICFAAGIYFNRYPHPDASLFLTLSVVGGAGALLCWLLHRPREALVAICLLFFCAGLLAAGRDLPAPLPESHISWMISDKEEAVLVGTLTRLPSRDGQSTKITLAADACRTEEMTGFRETSGTVLLTLKGEWPRALLPGTRIAVRAQLKRPSPIRTPGTFDYPRFLARKGIHVVGTVASALLIQPLTTEPAPGASLRYLAERLRTSIAYRLDDSLRPETAALYRAVLLGDRSAVEPAVLDAFKGAGVMHILAISGMHMALLGFFLFTGIFWLLRRSERLILAVNVRKAALLLCIPVLLLYTALAGAQPPVIRALIMSLFVVWACCTDRKRSPLTLVAAAALLMLAFDPTSLEDASFQLSFAAVAAILIITPVLTGWLPAPHEKDTGSAFLRASTRRLITAIAVSLSAIIGTAPMLLHLFHRLSTVSLPANLIIEPLICLWSLPCGFLALPFMSIWPPLAQAILQAGAPPLDLSVRAAVWLSDLPFSALWLPGPAMPATVLYYAALLMLTASPFASRRWYAAAAGLIGSLLLTAAPLTSIPGSFRQHDTVSVIDIGHGSATLLELAGGRTILIDGGGLAAPGFDSGERIIAPFLWHRRLARLDDIVLTHFDADHYNGIPAVIERFRPKRLWLPYEQPPEPARDLLELARRYGALTIVPRTADAFMGFDSRLRFPGLPAAGTDVIMQGTQGGVGSGAAENDRGLIVKLVTPGFSMLFPGDISAERERVLAETENGLAANIVLASHHGSATSNSELFLQTIRPDWLVVSAGSRNPDLFPAASTRTTATRLGIGLLTTAEDGTITVQGGIDGYTVSAFNGRVLRKRVADPAEPPAHRPATPR